MTSGRINQVAIIIFLCYAPQELPLGSRAIKNEPKSPPVVPTSPRHSLLLTSPQQLYRQEVLAFARMENNNQNCSVSNSINLRANNHTTKTEAEPTLKASQIHSIQLCNWVLFVDSDYNGAISIPRLHARREKSVLRPPKQPFYPNC